MTLTEKLHPARFTGMSGKMAAIVGCILGQAWTSPAIAELTITSDGHVLARHEGDCGHNDYIGTVADLQKNWRRLLDAAGLTSPSDRKPRLRTSGPCMWPDTDHCLIRPRPSSLAMEIIMPVSSRGPGKVCRPHHVLR